MKLFYTVRKIGILSVLTLLLTPIFAQSDAPAEQAVKDHIQSFAEAYVKLPETKDKKAVLAHFAPELRSNIFYFSISGRARINNSTREGFDKYLANIANSTAMTMKYDIIDFSHVKVSDDNAVAVVQFAYEIKEEDGIWVKGEETANYALRKKDGDWTIVHMTIMGMEDEKLKGSCLCELFVEEGKSNGVVAKTTVPAGRNYTTHYNDFDFRSVNGAWLIKTETHRYRWKQGGEIKKMDESGATEVIGTADSRKSTILTILKDDLYKDNCASLKSRTKK